MLAPRYYDGRGHGPLLLGWLLPPSSRRRLAVLAVLALHRLTPMPLSPSPASSGVRPRTDAALEAARLRYAKGEITREEYIRVASDLGAPPPDRSEPPTEG